MTATANPKSPVAGKVPFPAGDLSKLSRFLYSVEKDPMALRMELVELGARDKEGQQLSLGLQLSGLVLNAPKQ